MCYARKNFRSNTPIVENPVSERPIGRPDTFGTMSTHKIAVGGDHAGYALKERIIAHLREVGAEVLDLGTDGTESTDYPDYAHAVATAVEERRADVGILVCGSGNGVNMVANKHQGIRAALAWNQELAALARSHNNANVLSLPARFMDDTEAMASVDKFLHTEFEGGRHQRRVDKIEPRH